MNKKLTKNLVFKKGIWFSKTKSNISYPEEASSIYYKLETESYWFKHRNDCIISLVKSFSPRKTLVDIGGGNGFVSHGLISEGNETILLEPNIAAVKNAKKRGLKDIICSSLEDCGLSKKSIDAAGVFDVIEHINNDIDFAERINMILKEKGKIYLTVPAFSFLWSNEDDYAGHFRRYTLKKINSVLKKAGFRIIYSTYFFSILVIPIFIFRSIPYLFGKKNRKSNKRYNKEHQLGGGILGNFVKIILDWEAERVSNLKTIPFGSSCLVVAQKIK